MYQQHSAILSASRPCRLPRAGGESDGPATNPPELSDEAATAGRAGSAAGDTSSRTLIEQLTAWASGLSLDDVPPRVVDYAKSQVLSQLAAARAGASHPLGERLRAAFGDHLQPDPDRTAVALGALTSWLHFDDTAYAGHLARAEVDDLVDPARERPLEVLGEEVRAQHDLRVKAAVEAVEGRERDSRKRRPRAQHAVAARLDEVACEPIVEQPRRRRTQRLGGALGADDVGGAARAARDAPRGVSSAPAHRHARAGAAGGGAATSSTCPSAASTTAP